MKAENIVLHWKKYSALKRAVYNFSGSESRYMRTLTGNFTNNKIPLKNAPWNAPGTYRKKLQKNYNILMNRLYSRKVHTPVLYKGLSKNNAKSFLTSINLKKRGFLKNAYFYTRAPTSSTTNITQAMEFTNYKNPVILVLNRDKRHAIILGHHGIKSRHPREREVILPPAKFVFNFKNNKGLYHVHLS